MLPNPSVDALSRWLDTCFKSLDDDIAASAKARFLTRTQVIPAKESYVYEQRCRARDAQAVVYQLIVLIRFGCTNSQCTTPYCFSNLKRSSKAPIRRPTLLTARMQAYTLASEPEAEQFLCPNPPLYDSIPVGESWLQSRADKDHHHQDGGPQGDDRPPMEAGHQAANRVVNPSSTPGTTPAKRAKLDRKSLSQNLFNTRLVSRFETGNIDRLIQLTLDQAIIAPIDTPVLAGLYAMISDPRTPQYRSRVGAFSEKWYASLIFDQEPYILAAGSIFRLFICTLHYNLSNSDRLVASFPELRRKLPAGLVSDDRACMNNELLEAFSNITQSSAAIVVICDSLSRIFMNSDTDSTTTSDDVWHITLVCIHFLASLGDASSSNDVSDIQLDSSTKVHSAIRRSTKLLANNNALYLTRKLLRFVDFHESRLNNEGQLVGFLGSLSASSENRELQTATTFYLRILSIIANDYGESPIVEKGSDLYLALKFHERLFKDLEAMNSTQEMYFSSMCRHQLVHIPEVKMAASLLRYEEHPYQHHLLDYPSLFDERYLTAVFRAICYLRMRDNCKTALSQRGLLDRVRVSPDAAWQNFIEARFGPALNRCLILEVNRETLLEDSFDQLWGKQLRELLRPFKVLIGGEYNEMGDDHGGPTREFFRFVFEKAFEPDAGLFIIDEVSGMPWFDPMSREPLATYELLGLLVSLAIHNGVHAPINFPLCFYAAVLDTTGGFGSDLDSIKDGWPQLHENLERLLNWADGDVGDVFDRTYAFSVRDCDRVYEINMDFAPRWNSPIERLVETRLPAVLAASPWLFSPAPLVTNENRAMFVKDYTGWLVKTSVWPQLLAFKKGFKKCLDPRALGLITSPTMLKSITEGQSYISFEAIRQITSYKGGFSIEHPLIQSFWRIVLAYPADKQRTLLEFVTASDRIPVQGVKSMLFVIEKTFEGTERLPSSQTCFSTLKMPEYEDERKLMEKLDVVLEFGARGFGVG